MHGLFARAAAESHADVLECRRQARPAVPVNVREAYEGVGVVGLRPDLRRAAFLLLYLHLDVRLSSQAVGDDDGRLHGSVGVSFEHCVLDVVDGVGSHTGVERVCVGEEGLRATFLHLPHHLAHHLRSEVRAVAELAERHLDRRQVALFNKLRAFGGVKERSHLLAQVLLRPGDLRACEVYFARHGSRLASSQALGINQDIKSTSAMILPFAGAK